MAILVTGGAGYIGSHTCVELLDAGYDVVVVDNFSNSKPQALDRVRMVGARDFKSYNIDILNRKGLRRVFDDNDIDAVIHFAGLKAVGESVVSPVRYYHNNIGGTIVLCDIMKEYGVKAMVFSSSATVYGSPSSTPACEDYPTSAASPYGRSKIMIEEILKDVYASDNEWSIMLLRYFNPAGAHKSGMMGEDPDGEPSNLMPCITQVAVGKLKELKVFGSDYDTADGTGVRDYIHVMDLAAGHIKALDKALKSTGVGIYNLGTGRGYSVLQVVQAFERASGRKIPYTIVGRRPGDVAECYADPTRARDELGWTAMYGIDEMCRDAWRWQVNNPYGYR